MKSLITSIGNRLFSRGRFSSSDYWGKRYKAGGNSGPGSYGQLAEFKANVLNKFTGENGIESVIEFGCGDGNQLTLAKYKKYTGYDISQEAVETCQKLFKDDASKNFFPLRDYDGLKADLVISLDVIFHLIEDDTFDAYMRRLFDASSKYVVIYSSNQDEPIEPSSKHVRHRNFSSWIEREISREWKIKEKIPNAYPYNGDYKSTSFSDFFIYEKI